MTISIIISIAAFAVAAYGIIERRTAANRAERIRLTAVVEELARTRYQITELASKGTTQGDLIEALNSRIELLSQQAKSLIQEHELTITSTECREVAYCLTLAGYREDADNIWELARDTARAEGKTQEFFANRGYAYFLFGSGRVDQAREVITEALSQHPTNTDPERISHASTLYVWAGWEIRTQGPNAQVVADLRQRINALISASSTPETKATIAAFVVSPSNQGNGTPNPGPPSGEPH